MSELKRYTPWTNEGIDTEVYLADDVDKHIEELKQRIKELADNLEEAEDLHTEWKNEVAPKISELKQRNKEFFIAGFEAGKLNEKKANHKMPGTIMHADSAYEAYLGYRDIQNES